MNLKISIHQPHYLPWAPYFYKIITSDIFVFLDDTQFDRSDFQHRNYVGTSMSNRTLLTIPIKHSGCFVTLNKAEFANDFWEKKHLRTIENLFCHEKYFKDVFPIVKTSICYSASNLAEFNINFIKNIINYLGINTKLIRSSKIKSSSKKEDKLIDILTELGAESYLTGEESLNNYLHKDKFEKKNINLIKLVYPLNCPLSKDSILDILFLKSPQEVIKIIKDGGQETIC